MTFVTASTLRSHSGSRKPVGGNGSPDNNTDTIWRRPSGKASTDTAHPLQMIDALSVAPSSSGIRLRAALRWNASSDDGASAEQQNERTASKPPQRFSSRAGQREHASAFPNLMTVFSPAHGSPIVRPAAVA